MDGTGCGGACSCGARREEPAALPGLSRRTFVLQGAVTAIGLAMAACSGLGGGVPTAPGNVSLTLNIANYPALATVGGVAYASASGTPLAVVRVATDTFTALSRICPHQGGTVGAVTGGLFVCPNHGATFDDYGHWVGGQPTGNLTSYQTSFDSATGTLTIG